jgi:hypothetical protein
MGLSSIKSKLILNLKNIPGPTVKSKILVIECDDWGSSRMPNKESQKKLIEKGFKLNNRYDKFDTLEDENDLTALFETLNGVKDSIGKPAVMTPFVNANNPDFKKIKEHNFTKCYFEPFTKTLENYGRGTKNIELWKQGINEGVFVPEYHGNSHVNTPIWLDALRGGNKILLDAFEEGYIATPIQGINPNARSFRPELFFENDSQFREINQNLLDGIDVFKGVFGYQPRIFAPTNGIFHPDFESELYKNGILYLIASWFTNISDKKGGIKKKFYNLGSRGKSGLTYYSRNGAFEPTENGYGGIGTTIKQVEASFAFNKPAIISTHRVNYIGALNESNRKFGLLELKNLILTVKSNWPDVKFMSSTDMLKELFPEPQN